MKQKNVTVILAFFLGGIGMHDFYLERYVLGVLKALFFWTLIPAFVALFDVFYFIFMDIETFNAKYNATDK